MIVTLLNGDAFLAEDISAIILAVSRGTASVIIYLRGRAQGIDYVIGCADIATMVSARDEAIDKWKAALASCKADDRALP